jgi:hypothetical protein
MFPQVRSVPVNEECFVGEERFSYLKVFQNVRSISVSEECFSNSVVFQQARGVLVSEEYSSKSGAIQ